MLAETHSMLERAERGGVAPRAAPLTNDDDGASTMAKSHPIPITDLIEMYCGGASIPQIADQVGLSRSTVRYHLQRAGVLRSRTEAVRLAADQGRLGSGLRGKSVEFSDERRSNISRGREKWAEANSVGVSVKPDGYVEFTRGEHKGRSLHVVKMEERIGRPLRDDECVHHIDGDRGNNDDDNLALVTRSGHTRLHRHEDALAGKQQERDGNGRFR